MLSLVVSTVPGVVSGVVSAEDPVPKDNDVVAGAWGALFFILLITATVLLLRNFLKQMRKVDAAEDSGVFDEHQANEADRATDAAEGANMGIDKGAGGSEDGVNGG